MSNILASTSTNFWQNIINAFNLIFSSSYDQYYHKKLYTSLEETFQMVFISGIFSLVIGIFIGVLLTLFKKGGLKENRVLYSILSTIINILRSIPFIILIVLLVPLTRKMVGTSIGVTGAIVPLIFGTVPFFSRQIETALSSVEEGKIEAARACGSSTIGIVFRVYLHEAVPQIIRGTTITAISLIGITAIAGATLGAGGLGDLAVNFGNALNRQDIIIACVIFLLIIVSLIQLIGTLFARLTTNRKILG